MKTITELTDERRREERRRAVRFALVLAVQIVAVVGAGALVWRWYEKALGQVRYDLKHYGVDVD